MRADLNGFSRRKGFPEPARPRRRCDRLRRRAFVTVLGGAALWPLVGNAEQPERLRRVGALIGFPENDPFAHKVVSAFTDALGRFGWAEGGNIRIDYRFAAGDPTLYKTYAAELIALSPDAILAIPAAGAVALREKTSAIPIVFVLAPDPVGSGLVQSLARPGGNATGFSSYDAPMMGKWLQLLKEVAPDVTRVLVIFNPDTAFASTAFASLVNRAIEAAAPSFGMTVTFAPVHDDADIEKATTAQAREPGGGLIVLPDSFTLTHREVVITAATPLRFTNDQLERACKGWRSDVLLVRPRRPVRASGILHRPYPKGRPVQPTSRFSSRRNTR
jgi:putative tryptophan/tyrosine transport system substrate-binding protein